MIALILLAVLIAVGIAVISEDEPQDPQDPKDPKESKAEMDNSEYDWGHNVKHRTEDDYE